ncbi:DUF4190 domain-containing protein [Agromyces mediolanus]|uniref:DUF4190 domain-containing protein n=1 Tax=Agromyces mediolanus TaxID=41986 RepID=UPI00203D2A90|nr:DUF4190 domain-containing protein [Agromyces mediolanus]MCM3655721.1 DUF4190 domain-containing protein [Agromyces mediolanus]
MSDPRQNSDPAFTPASADFGMATSATPPEDPIVPNYVDQESRIQAPPKTNTLAVVSLVASLAGLLTGFGFLVGIICGHISLSQIKKTGEQGHGAALAGTIIGYVGIALSVIVVVVIIVMAAAAATMSSVSG